MANKVKAKPKKAILARFRVTKNGKVMHKSGGKSHILTKKTSERKRRLAKTKALESPAMASTYKKLMKGQ